MEYDQIFNNDEKKFQFSINQNNNRTTLNE